MQNGVTSLIAASDQGHLDIVKFLLQMNAHINAQTKVGTPNSIHDQ